MYNLARLTLLAGACCACASAFVSPLSSSTRSTPLHAAASSSSSDKVLKAGDPVLLVGPGFLQLVLARHLKKAGLRPIVVAPQKKLDSFFSNLLIDKEIQADSTIGMPETGDPYFGDIKGVVFCAEDAILPSDFVNRVLDFTHEGKSAFAGDDGPTRVVCCLPVSDKVQQVKSNSWIPIFNNDRTVTQNWINFRDKFQGHPVYSNGVGSILRIGSLFGGSIDGEDFLKDYGIDEGMYKMSLEQYRDLRERAFDRYRLGAQILDGDSINPKPPNQDKSEKEAFRKASDQIKEGFNILGGYPEIDRACRHTVAAAITQSLMLPVGDVVPKECTILSKASAELPLTTEEWTELFQNPGAAEWPNPFTFRPADYGIEEPVAN